MPSSPPPRWRRLKPNHGTEAPSSLLFLDTESCEEVIRVHPKKALYSFLLGCCTYVRLEDGKVTRRDTLDSESIPEIWDWIESKQLKERPLWIFAHNMKHDLTELCFWDLLESGRYRAGLTPADASNGVLSGQKSYRGKLCLEGFPYFIYCMGQRGICKFVDTSNYFPGPLEKLGEALDRPKTKWPGFAATLPELYAYCRNDVDIIEDAMVRTLKLWRESDGGVFQPTAAMLAMTSFRHKLPKRPKGKPQAHILYDDKSDWQVIEREAYYGGQTTCFYVGPVTALDDPSNAPERLLRVSDWERPTGPVYLLDVRSLYPSVMRSHRFPFRRLERTRRISPEQLVRKMAALGAIARVKIDSPTDEYTLRTERGQLQARGRFTTALAGPELERALRAGHVTEVLEAQIYCMDDLFSRFVDDWTERRDRADREGQKWISEYVKMILNSLSGKLAQTGKRWEERPKRVAPQPWGYWMEKDHDSGDVRHLRSVGGVVQEEVCGEPPLYTFPAISAYITAHGRERMRWLRSKCPVGSVLYQATDSLLCTKDGYLALVSQGLVRERELGSLYVKRVADDCEILGCNHYRFGIDWVRAGNWGRAERREDGTYWYTSWQGMKSLIEERPDGTITVEEHRLKTVGDYPKGQVLENGYTEFPLLGVSDLPPELDMPDPRPDPVDRKHSWEDGPYRPERRKASKGRASR